MNLRAASILMLLVSLARGAAHPEAGSVLILVNDAVPPEAGTGIKGASIFVGEYYAAQRGVPASQILHMNIPMLGTPLDWDSWNMHWAKFDTYIRQPLKKYLSESGLADKINYIVPVYGIPVRTWDVTDKIEGLSVDSLIASVNATQIAQFLVNPYYSPWNEGRVHLRNFRNPGGWKMYAVTRLDGPSVQVAVGLVDKAIRAEANLKTIDGTAYFDYRHVAQGDAYYTADQTVVNAYGMAKGLGYAAVFNDNQLDAAKMLHSAPKTLWAWGWYSGPFAWDGYEFVEGAVGAQLTSYTANSIRTMMPGTWVPLWLNAGITATWGATTEPYTVGYANGDNLLNKFWSGYNFGESAYLATPYLNHAMIFLGDPLYAPKVFQPGKLAAKAPLIVSAADGTNGIAPGSIAAIVGTGLSNCTAVNHASALPATLCGTSVTMNGEAAPLFYVSPTQINVLVPRGLTPGRDVEIGVSREDGDTGGGTLEAARFTAQAPGIFQSQADGVTRAIVQNADYSTNGPQRPLKLGEAAVAYAGGLGATDNAVADTAPAPRTPLARVLAAVQVFVNGMSQNMLFAGLTPGQFGLYQVNFVVDPATPVADGDGNAVWLTVNGVETPHLRISLSK